MAQRKSPPRDVPPHEEKATPPEPADQLAAEAAAESSVSTHDAAAMAQAGVAPPDGAPTEEREYGPPPPGSTPVGQAPPPVETAGMRARASAAIGVENPDNGRRLARALDEIEKAKTGLIAVADAPDELVVEAAARYLAARDGMSEASRPFGPPR